MQSMETPGSIYFDAQPEKPEEQTYINDGLSNAELYANIGNEGGNIEAPEPHIVADGTIVTIFDALAIDYQPSPATTPEMTTVSSDTTNFKDKPSTTDHDWD